MTSREKHLKQLLEDYNQDRTKLLEALQRTHSLPDSELRTQDISCPLIQESLINHANHPTRISQMARKSGVTWPFKMDTSPGEFMGYTGEPCSLVEWKPSLRRSE